MAWSKFAYLSRMTRYWSVYHRYRSRTMVKKLTYIENLALSSLALTNDALRGGAIVECGTWRGGMSAGLIEVGGPRRRYCFFDSFEGLPPAEEIDGEKAQRWQANKTSPGYYDNCRASLEEFEQTIALTGCPGNMIEVQKGFFNDTLPRFNAPQIAVLRLDTDWYSSTMICLQKFWDHVLPGGIILVDDYYDWDGCSRAVHDFLSERKATERIRQGGLARVAFIRKE